MKPEGAGRLTLGAYRDLGGLHGAISRRVDLLLEEFREAEDAVDLNSALAPIFQAIARIDATGSATRWRTFRENLMATPSPTPRLVEMLIRERILLGEEVGGRATVTLAHEALLQEWPALKNWLDINREQIQRIQRHLLNLTLSNPEDKYVRGRAAEALGGMGPAAAEAVPALISALCDDSSYVRPKAALSLAQIGLAPENVVPALVRTLRDKKPHVREAAATALGQFGPAAAKAVSALINAFEDREKIVRLQAAVALGKIGPAAASAAPALTVLLDDEREILECAAGALERIGPAAGPALIKVLAEGNESARRRAAEGLEVIEPATPEVLSALNKALKDEERSVRDAATRALERLRRPRSA
jgi:hypothetical protein